MRTYIKDGIYGEGTVYVMETLEDFDVYEKILKDEDLMQYNPNFYAFKKDFKMHIGKIWTDKSSIRYRINGRPIYKKYKLIAMEDSDPDADWYWVAQNIDDERDVRYLLCNTRDIYEGL